MTTSAQRAPETGTTPLPEGGQAAAGARPRWLHPVWSLAAASFFAPALVWAQSSERAGIAGYLLIGACLLALGLLLRRLMLLAHLDPEGSTVVIAVLIVGLTNAGLLLDSFHRLVVLSGIMGLAAIAYRLRDFGPWRLIVTWGLIALITYPLLVAMSSRVAAAPPTIAQSSPVTAEFTAEKRDLVIVILDGYANTTVLAELYGIDTSGFEATLEANGFELGNNTVANYGRTRFSVASVLQLDYPVTQGTLSAGDLNWLLEVIGGNHRLGAWLKQNGYRHVYVESGWFGTRCRSSVDICVEGPWPDESFYDFTNRTVVRDLPGLETGRSFTRGALRVMDWLDDDLADLLRDDIPDLVYAHVLAPHPPLFLDENCGMRAQEGIKGFSMAQPGMTPADLEEARKWYGRQVACVNHVLAELAELAQETDSIVVMFGDHGPDSLGQLYVHGAEWNEDQRFERFGAMLAIRAPRCDVSGVQSLVNVGRRLVSCLSDGSLPDLPTATYESELTEQGERIVEVPTPRYGEGA